MLVLDQHEFNQVLPKLILAFTKIFCISGSQKGIKFLSYFFPYQISMRSPQLFIATALRTMCCSHTTLIHNHFLTGLGFKLYKERQHSHHLFVGKHILHKASDNMGEMSPNLWSLIHACEEEGSLSGRSLCLHCRFHSIHGGVTSKEPFK